MNNWVFVKKEAEPRGEQGAVEILDGLPHIAAKDIIKGLLKVAGKNGTPKCSSGLGKLHIFFGSARNTDAEIEGRYEVEGASIGDGLLCDHVGSDADIGFGNAKVAEFDVLEVGGFVKEAAFERGSPVTQPGQ